MTSLAEPTVEAAAPVSRPTTQQSKGRLVLEVDDFVLANKLMAVRIHEVQSFGSAPATPSSLSARPGSTATEQRPLSAAASSDGSAIDNTFIDANAMTTTAFYITAVDEVENEYSLTISIAKATYLYRVEREAAHRESGGNDDSTSGSSEPTATIDELAASVLTHLDIIGNRHRDIGKLTWREPQAHVPKKARVSPVRKNGPSSQKRLDQRAARSLKATVKTREAIELALKRSSAHAPPAISSSGDPSDATTTSDTVESERLSPRTRKARKSSDYRLLTRMAVADAKTVWKAQLESIHDDPSFRKLVVNEHSKAVIRQMQPVGEAPSTLATIKRAVPEKKKKHKELQQRRDKGREARLRVARTASTSTINELTSDDAIADDDDERGGTLRSPRASSSIEDNNEEADGNDAKQLAPLSNSPSRRTLLAQGASVGQLRALAFAATSFSRRSLVLLEQQQQQPREPEQFLRRRSLTSSARVLKAESNAFSDLPGMGIEITTERPPSHRNSLVGASQLDEAIRSERRGSIVGDVDGIMRRRRSSIEPLSPARKQSIDIAMADASAVLATSTSAPEFSRLPATAATATATPTNASSPRMPPLRLPSSPRVDAAPAAVATAFASTYRTDASSNRSDDRVVVQSNEDASLFLLTRRFGSEEDEDKPAYALLSSQDANHVAPATAHPVTSPCHPSPVEAATTPSLLMAASAIDRSTSALSARVASPRTIMDGQTNEHASLSPRSSGLSHTQRTRTFEVCETEDGDDITSRADALASDEQAHRLEEECVAMSADTSRQPSTLDQTDTIAPELKPSDFIQADLTLMLTPHQACWADEQPHERIRCTTPRSARLPPLGNASDYVSSETATTPLVASPLPFGGDSALAAACSVDESALSPRGVSSDAQQLSIAAAHASSDDVGAFEDAVDYVQSMPAAAAITLQPLIDAACDQLQPDSVDAIDDTNASLVPSGAAVDSSDSWTDETTIDCDAMEPDASDEVPSACAHDNDTSWGIIGDSATRQSIDDDALASAATTCSELDERVDALVGCVAVEASDGARDAMEGDDVCALDDGTFACSDSSEVQEHDAQVPLDTAMATTDADVDAAAEADAESSSVEFTAAAKEDAEPSIIELKAALAEVDEETATTTEALKETAAKADAEPVSIDVVTTADAPSESRSVTPDVASNDLSATISSADTAHVSQVPDSCNTMEETPKYATLLTTPLSSRLEATSDLTLSPSKQSRELSASTGHRKSRLETQPADVVATPNESLSPVKATRKSHVKTLSHTPSTSDDAVNRSVHSDEHSVQHAPAAETEAAVATTTPPTRSKHSKRSSSTTHTKRTSSEATTTTLLHASPLYHKRWSRWPRDPLVVDKISCLQLEELVLQTPQNDALVEKLGMRYARWSNTSVAAILLLEHATSLRLDDAASRTHAYWNALGTAHFDVFLRHRKFLPVAAFHLNKCLDAITHALASSIESMADPLLRLRYAICLFWRHSDDNDIAAVDNILRDVMATCATFWDADCLNLTFLRFQTLVRLRRYDDATVCIEDVVRMHTAATAGTTAAAEPPQPADHNVPSSYDTIDYLLMLLHCQQYNGDAAAAAATMASILEMQGVATDEDSEGTTLSDAQTLELWVNVATKCFLHEEYALALEFYATALSFAMDASMLARIHYSRGLCFQAVGADATNVVAEFKRARSVDRHAAPLVPLVDLHATTYDAEFAALQHKPIQQIIDEVRVLLYDKAAKKLQRLFRRKRKSPSRRVDGDNDNATSRRKSKSRSRKDSSGSGAGHCSPVRAAQRTSLLSRQQSGGAATLSAAEAVRPTEQQEHAHNEDTRVPSAASDVAVADPTVLHEQFVARQRAAAAAIDQIRSDPRYHRPLVYHLSSATAVSSSALSSAQPPSISKAAASSTPKKVKSMSPATFASHTSGLLNPDHNRPELRRKQSMETFNKLGYVPAAMPCLEYWDKLLAVAPYLFESRSTLHRSLACIRAALPQVTDAIAFCALAECCGLVGDAIEHLHDPSYEREVAYVCTVVDVTKQLQQLRFEPHRSAVASSTPAADALLLPLDSPVRFPSIGSVVLADVSTTADTTAAVDSACATSSSSPRTALPPFVAALSPHDVSSTTSTSIPKPLPSLLKHTRAASMRVGDMVNAHFADRKRMQEQLLRQQQQRDDHVAFTRSSATSSSPALVSPRTSPRKASAGVTLHALAGENIAVVHSFRAANSALLHTQQSFGGPRR